MFNLGTTVISEKQLINIFQLIKVQNNKTVKSTILEIRSVIVDNFLLVFSVLAIPALIASISRAASIGWKPIMEVHIALVCLSWFFYLRRKHFPLVYKATFIISVFLVIGFGGLFQFGLISGAIILIITAPLLAVLFFNDRVGYSIFSVNLIFVAFIGFLTVKGYLTHDFDLEFYSTSASAWITLLFATLLFGGSLTVSMSVFIKYLLNVLDVARKGEAELKKHKAELENIIYEKTKELKQSNKALEQFARVAAHDMNSPLNIISSGAQVLQMTYDNKLEDDANKILDDIVESAKYMSLILQEQLMNSKFEKDNIEFDSLDMNKVLEKAIHQLQTEIDNSKAQITHDTLPSVYVNETQFIRIFQNIISNAIKYRNKDRQLKIHVSVKEAGESWLFSIADNGIGIEPNETKNIFEIFHQVSQSETTEGVGIGLASCKKIIESYGGEIWVESELGVGSIFYFSLKRSD